MAPKKRTPEQIERELAAERQGLTAAVEDLREATNVGRKLKAKLPVAAAGALGVGFFLAGGIGATVRLLFRRGRE
jgi:hypothetical protein